MLTAPITNANFRQRVLDVVVAYSRGESSTACISNITAEDSDLCPGDETTSIIATASPWICLCSPDPVVSDISKQVLDLEVAYASFCGVGNIIIPGPRRYGESAASRLPQYAFAVHDALQLGNFYQLQVRVPMKEGHQRESERSEFDSYPSSNGETNRKRTAFDGYNDQNMDSLDHYERSEFAVEKTLTTSKGKGTFATWDAWNTVRSICGYSSRLSVALVIPKTLPPFALQSRWFSEPLRILLLGGCVFVKNKVGFPALPSDHQSLLSHYMRVKQPPWLLLSGADHLPSLDAPDKTPMGIGMDNLVFPTPAEADSHDVSRASTGRSELTLHIDYMRHFQRKQQPFSAVEQFSSGYQDYLQSPLQPLADNLESVTYEVFEKDPVKYDQYERAIAAALREWMDNRKPRHRKDRIVVAIVGAGRGPLVSRALQASEKTDVKIDLWAVEKNPNAFVLLQRHNKELWRGEVNLVQSDMRSWKGPASKGQARQKPYSIDILISELLGSFADNELSPECLDAVTPLLTPDHGISIPSSYTSFLTPIATPRIHADLLTRSGSDSTAQQMPWVSMLHSFDFLSQRPSTNGHVNGTLNPFKESNPMVLSAWSFQHLSPSSTDRDRGTSNRRQCRLAFPIQDRAVCHGIAGYFEAVLYPGIELSTNPLTMAEKSPDMTSWFPIFYPLKVGIDTDTPVLAHANQAVESSIFAR